MSIIYVENITTHWVATTSVGLITCDDQTYLALSDPHEVFVSFFPTFCFFLPYHLRSAVSMFFVVTCFVLFLR